MRLPHAETRTIPGPAGNQAELAVHPGGVHGFNLFPTPLAGPADRRSQDFVAERLAQG